MKPLSLVTVIVALCILSNGCTSGKQKTLGQLKYEQKEEEPIVFEKLNHEQVREEYKELLDVFEDNKLKEQIERRIADVYMIEGNQDLESNTRKSSYYVDAIKAYKNILERYPNSPDNAEVLYQLAKAYDLEGQQSQAKKMLLVLTQRHPNYTNNGEAYFRLGDIYFGEANYRSATESYQAVTQFSDEKLSLNARYMLGWSQYKLAKYRSSTKTFSLVLATYLKGNEDAESLSNGEQTIVKDTLHSLSLSIDKIGGAASIASIEKLSNKPYTWLIYDTLGSFYFEKELYEQASDTYRQFLKTNALSKRAPKFHDNIIQTYTNGSFPKLALDEKQKYIVNFGVRSEYHKHPGVNQETLANLRVYLDELARHNYHLGTEAEKKLVELASIKNPKPDLLKKVTKAKQLGFETAADFYGEYLDTFPKDARFDEIVFLQAEAFFSSKRYAEAAKNYEHVAYTPLGQSAKKHASDAGYSAILSFQNLVDLNLAENGQHTQWQIKAVDSMLRFAGSYPADKRSPKVLTTAAEYLFSLNQYQRAIDIGNNLIAKSSGLDGELKKTALGIIAHSYFKLDNFPQAQSNYVRQRDLTAVDSEEYTTLSERIASTTYKNYEQKLANDDKPGAIEQLLLIKKLSPQSPVRVIAQYDAASLMLELTRWDSAIPELQELIVNFPKHELTPEFPRKLAYAYRASEKWALAAQAYLNLNKTDANPDIRREALFAAAEMFEQNLSYATAITHYKSYAYAYEQPFATRMEARYKLATNYSQIGEPSKSLYWLRRIIDGHSEAGTHQTDRSRWLASWAHMEYGDSFAKDYQTKRLRLPIVKSLPKKRQAMQYAIQHYEKAADLGILDFVTQSGFKIAGLYSDLGEKLLKSPRPRGLSEQDMQTYNAIMTQQSSPLMALAVNLHLSNAERAWEGEFNTWIDKSFHALSMLKPDRFNKQEKLVSYGDEIR